MLKIVKKLKMSKANKLIAVESKSYRSKCFRPELSSSMSNVVCPIDTVGLQITSEDYHLFVSRTIDCLSVVMDLLGDLGVDLDVRVVVYDVISTLNFGNVPKYKLKTDNIKVESVELSKLLVLIVNRLDAMLYSLTTNSNLHDEFEVKCIRTFGFVAKELESIL